MTISYVFIYIRGFIMHFIIFKIIEKILLIYSMVLQNNLLGTTNGTFILCTLSWCLLLFLWTYIYIYMLYVY